MERYGSIYVISNLINAKIYVGQTITSVAQRWAKHLSDARNGSNSLLHRAIRKYGVESFGVREIGRRPLSELDHCEIVCIKYYDSYNSGYNMTLGGYGHHNVEDSEVDLVLMLWKAGYGVCAIATDLGRSVATIRSVLAQVGVSSDQLKERSSATKTSFIARKVVQIDFKTATVVNVFDTVTAAAMHIKKQPSTITNCCQNIIASAGGFYWRYLDESELNQGVYTGTLPENYGYGHNAGSTGKYDYQEIVELWQTGLNGTQICELIGCSSNVVGCALKAIGVTAEERRLRQIVSKGVSVNQYSEQNEFLCTYPSVAAASREVNASRKSIRNAINYGQLCKGFRWKYK